MREVAPAHELVRFGPFEVDLRNRLMRKHGLKIRLQDQPFHILQILLEHPGELVSREELQRRIWPADTFVDFEQGLNNAIMRLREALCDSADTPLYVETIPKHGYRFVAEVQRSGSKGSTEAPVTTEAAEKPLAQMAQTGTSLGRRTIASLVETVGEYRRAKRVWMAIAAGLAIGAVALILVELNVVKVRGWHERVFGGSREPGIHSLAVLPLANLSNDPNQEYFSDGMTDALITNLAQIGSLKVISRTSTMQYKQTKKALPEIARELNVDGIIEGTVQRSGDYVRITAQLIYAPSDKHLWANSYERDLRDVFALERDVTEDIAHQVRAQIRAPDSTSGTHAQPTDPVALEAYLQGSHHLHAFGRGSGDDEQKKAIESFQDAIRADPNFAPAYLGLANAHSALWPSSDDAEIARNSVEKAAVLDPAFPEAQLALGDIKASNWDWSGAERDYRRAIALSPNYAQAHATLCYLLGTVGRKEEAIRECTTAQELDPGQEYLAEALYLFRHDYDGAISIATIVLRSDPDIGYLHQELFRYYAAKGMFKESVQELEKLTTWFGLPKNADRIHRAFATSGYQGAVQQWAKELEVLVATKQLYAPINMALAYAILDEKDEAFYWLEQAYTQHHLQPVITDMSMEGITNDPLFEPLRGDPRYKELLRRMGLSELHVDETGASGQQNGP